MRQIRVLLVDDAVVIRRLVADALASDADINVVGTAVNGRLGLGKIPQLDPDVVILDVEMPEMDGLQTLAAIRQTYPRLPVIMFSTGTEEGAAVTVEALTLGANDYVTKPANVGSVNVAIERVRNEMIPKIKRLCASAVGIALPPPPPASVSIHTPTHAKVAPGNAAPIEILAIGVSTGGPNALSTLFANLPGDLPVPIVLVQHMPPMFTKLLAERLDANSAVCVHEGVAGAVIEPGKAWIAPGDFHMVLTRDNKDVRLGLNQAPPENSCRPAVDVLFRSVAELYGAHTLAVILTGMGHDGFSGCEHVRAAGGQIVVQDEATSVVWGMPGFVARANMADAVLPLEQIGDDIVKRICASRQPVKAI